MFTDATPMLGQWANWRWSNVIL